MKIATWNVNSIKIRTDDVLRWLGETKTDVLCLQEIKCVNENFPREAFENIGYDSVFLGQKSYNGVAILSNKKIEDVHYNFPDDTEESPKRLIAATVNNVRVINTYVPNGTELGTDKFDFKLNWMQRLRTYFDETCHTEKNVLWCGDFNVAADERDIYDPIKKAKDLGFTKTERIALDYIKRWGFVDCFRKFEEAGGHFSWWHYREGSFQKDLGWRIDYVWTSQVLADKCVACWIDKNPRTWERPSDHTPVVGEFDL
jgi:exodeoxyribonuclease III